MATDATGTPTSLGIPKYNTAVDAPTGRGFNAAMDVIDGLIITAKKVAVKLSGVLQGTRTNLNFIQGAGITLSVADNAGADSVDVTVAATAATVSAEKNGSAVVSSRGTVNYIEGANVTLTVADNPGSARTDVTIASASAPSTTFPVKKAEVTQGTRGGIDFEQGTGMTLTVTDNPGGNDVQIKQDWNGLGIKTAGTLRGTRRNINLIAGTGISLTPVDQAGSDTVDVTIADTNSTPAISWTTIGAFSNAWVDEGSGAFFSPGYAKSADGMLVYMRGALKSGASGTAAFTLPVGFRPSKAVRLASASSSSGTSTCAIAISTGGVVSIEFGGTPSSMMLDGIVFAL